MLEEVQFGVLRRRVVSATYGAFYLSIRMAIQLKFFNFEIIES